MGQNIAHAKTAVHDVASSRDAREAGAKVWTLWKNAEGGAFVLAMARFLVSASDISIGATAHFHCLHLIAQSAAACTRTRASCNFVSVCCQFPTAAH